MYWKLKMLKVSRIKFSIRESSLSRCKELKSRRCPMLKKLRTILPLHRVAA
jgi:hypothetical protein